MLLCCFFLENTMYSIKSRKIFLKHKYNIYIYSNRYSEYIHNMNNTNLVKLIAIENSYTMTLVKIV